ncbi:MAG: putative Nudix hydrolase NudL [Anaerolineales bacterium]|nr:putative Nudix hydrolase NudL [Anaerolineales bacterium]WKZ49190.1 MAG: CoA pyrophosphatase [Anaerolineales bacterium]
MNLTEEFISQRLHEALASAGPSSDGYAEIDLNNKPELKCAAVLVPLVWQDDEWRILFTRRTDKVESHKGQVSFPGGACDEGETTPEQTALREMEEEIGIRADDVKTLGRLANLITISFFRVTPVVGVVKWPNVFRVGENEVARVFTIPLEWLANASNRWQFEIPGAKRSVIAYHPYDGELLWGATARMTVDFLKVLGF